MVLSSILLSVNFVLLLQKSLLFILALNLGKDKTTGLVESVGPERIRADGKAVTTPLENPELINPVE